MGGAGPADRGGTDRGNLSFLPPFASSCSRRQAWRGRRRQEGRNFDLSEVQHPLVAAFFPDQVSIDATAKHNPGLGKSPSVAAGGGRDFHENLWEIDIAMPGGLYPFSGPAGSDRFASTQRSRPRGGQFSRGFFHSLCPKNRKMSREAPITKSRTSGGKCSSTWAMAKMIRPARIRNRLDFRGLRRHQLSKLRSSQ